MFPYFGTKANIAKLYPSPKQDIIVEPFAGAAGYSMLHFEKEVYLYDKYDVIVNIWKWLQKCSEKDILSLPIKEDGDKILLEEFDCVEAFNMMGFIINEGSATPKHYSRFGYKNVKNILNKISKNIFKIKHWKIECKDYRLIDNIKGTYFIDPPYQKEGKFYVHNTSQINFLSLGEWCKSRNGQVIVCDNITANWLDFVPISNNKGASNNKMIEGIWTNEKTVLNNTQISMF